MNSDEKELIDTEKAAEILSLKKTYLEHLRCVGNGPKFKKVGKYVRYSKADIKEWVQKLESHASTSAY